MALLVRLIALLLLIAWAGQAGAAENDLTIPEAETKPYELGGRLEFRYIYHLLDEDSTRYKVNYYADPPGSYTQEWKGVAELFGAYRRGIFQAKLLTHHEYLNEYEDQTWTNSVYEAYVTATPTANILLEAGKRTILWGTGYAWNPSGFLNRPKDPDDPAMSMKGRTILGGDFIKSFSSGPLSNLSLTALLVPVIGDWANPELGGSGDINYTAKLYLLFYNTDLDFIYFDGPDQPTSLGFDFAKNLAENFEVHGEMGLQLDAPRTVLDSAGNVSNSRENLLSYLVGLRYLNAYDTTFIAEYYHNGAGYDRDELDDFFTYQDNAYSQWLATGNAAVMQRANRVTRPYYAQRNFGRDYFYLKIQQKEPFDILYFYPYLSVIVNLQDLSFNVQPGMTYLPITNLEVNFRAGIPIGPHETDFGEKQDSFRPELWIRYYF